MAFAGLAGSAGAHHRYPFPHHHECATKRCAQHADRLYNRHQERLRKRREARELAEGWAIPEAIVMCESGGRNLSPNSASASGYYQIIRSTWEAYGGRAYASEAWLASRAQQSIVARRIWNAGGPEQWVCKA